MTLIDGKQLAKKIRKSLKEKVDREQIKPKLVVIWCGNNEASRVYDRIKSKACEEVGVKFEEYHFGENISETELIDFIYKLNNEESINGILVQYPIPKQISLQKIANAIDKNKDVDGFNPYNIGLLDSNCPVFTPCTPLGIMKMFEEYKIDLTGKKVVIIGRSNVVGKPMAECMLNANATVTICHSKTKNLKEELLKADVIISSAGKRNIVTADMVREGTVVIDVGTNRDENGKLCGDVDFENVKKKASYITPNPGGVGPMTVAMLLNNVIKAYEIQNGIINYD